MVSSRLRGRTLDDVPRFDSGGGTRPGQLPPLLAGPFLSLKSETPAATGAKQNKEYESMLNTTVTDFVTSGQKLAQVFRVTPDDADELLKLNTHNRTVRPQAVAALIAMIRAGDFVFNGEPIQFSKSGVLQNGQHRLMAISQSGLAVELLIVTGLPDSAQETMDSGRKRTAGDALKLHGYQNTNNLAALAGAMVAFEKSGNIELAVQKNAFVTTPEILRYVAENQWIVDDLQHISQVAKRIRFSAITIGLAWHTFKSISDSDAEAFWQRLISPAGHEDGSPILALREWAFRQNDNHQSRAWRRVELAVLIKSWNKYRIGEPILHLHWRPGGANPEKFPVAV